MQIIAYVVVVQMYERYRSGEEPPSELGASRDYNIDLVPKFIMVCGSYVNECILGFHVWIPT